jgi:hypothetical protein
MRGASMQPKVATLNSPIVEAMPTGPEVQLARDFLRGHTFNRAGSEIKPRAFAAAAKETGASHADLLSLIARSYMGGQGADIDRENEIHSITGG